MTMQLEIENELESYEVLKALIQRKEKLHSEKEKEYIDDLIDQFEGYNAYRVLIE
jgi:hypothetical protein